MALIVSGIVGRRLIAVSTAAVRTDLDHVPTPSVVIQENRKGLTTGAVWTATRDHETVVIPWTLTA